MYVIKFFLCVVEFAKFLIVFFVFFIRSIRHDCYRTKHFH